MKNLKILLALLVLSILAIIITGSVLSYVGIEHGPLLIKIGSIFFIVNLVLYLIVIVFFVLRNLLHLYAEKRQKVVGSKFRTRLVLAFVGLTLIPSVLLFILSNQLIDSSIDKWFSLEVQKPVTESMEIAKTFYAKERKNVQDYADFLAARYGEAEFAEPSSTGEGSLRIYVLKEPDQSGLVANAFKGTSDTEIVSLDVGDIVRAVSPIRAGGQTSGVVVVETVIARDIVNKLEAMRKAYNEYNQIEVQQDPIRFLYFFMLTVATLLIIFLALWVSLRIAKGITIPIRSLAEATRKVASGDLNLRMDLARDDEIGLLVNSFNKMLDDLQQGKRSLEKAYAESDQQRLSMEAILENIHTGVIFLERSGRIDTLNNAACAMLNLQREDIIGKSHRVLLEKIKSNDLNEMVKKLGEKDFRAAEREIHSYIDGRPVSLRIYMTVLKDSRGKFIGILVVFDDLTEIITAQRALAWQEVAKRITHEIKNPLTPIKLSAERLMKKWDEKRDDFESVLRRATRTIVQEVESMRNLVNEFTKFGKMPKMNFATANVNSIIEEVADLYNDLKEVQIITSLQGIPEIDVDREQIKRALINLFDNAIKAKTERIWINTSFDPALEIIRIEVIDEGVGIKDDDRHKLFFPYFSTKKEGMGLGLAIVSTIISKHKGYVRAKGSENRGAHFIIELPVSQN